MKKFTLANKAYDTIKIIITAIIPLLFAFFLILNAAWGWNAPVEALSVTVSGFEALGGGIMFAMSKAYAKYHNGEELEDGNSYIQQK